MCGVEQDELEEAVRMKGVWTFEGPVALDMDAFITLLCKRTCVEMIAATYMCKCTQILSDVAVSALKTYRFSVTHNTELKRDARL